MEDDNGLDLSLSLPYGGKSTSSKVKNATCLEAKAESADRGSKLIHDFKNFLDGPTQNEDHVIVSEKSNPVKPEENLFYDLSSSNEELADNCNKRKNLFDEINHQKRHEREPHLADLLDKRASASHISITKDECSTAENEDVADSEAEGSTSKHNGNVGLYESKKEVNGNLTSNGNYLQEIRRFPNAVTGMMTSGAPQPVIPAASPMMFGYSRVQMPIADPVNALKPFEEGLSSNTTTITPGIAAQLKFGGNGSSPDLPWVSTTGPGPNGKTISGVTYKHNGSLTRVVCACHGSHMSVEEFVQHANEQPPTQNQNNGGLASVPNSNPAASAQS